MQYILLSKMWSILKSVIVFVILVMCICMHVSESTVTKGVLPLYSDTFDKVGNGNVGVKSVKPYCKVQTADYTVTLTLTLLFSSTTDTRRVAAGRNSVCKHAGELLIKSSK